MISTVLALVYGSTGFQVIVPPYFTNRVEQIITMLLGAGSLPYSGRREPQPSTEKVE